jgi:hypothetical protein
MRMWPHSQVLPVFSTNGWWCQLCAACQVWSGFECWVHTNHPQHWLRRRVWLPLWQRCRHCVGELGCGVCLAMHPAATNETLRCTVASHSNDQQFANHSNSHALAAFVSWLFPFDTMDTTPTWSAQADQPIQYFAPRRLFSLLFVSKRFDEMQQMHKTLRCSLRWG